MGRLSASSISFDENPTHPNAPDYDPGLWRDGDRRMKVICPPPHAPECAGEVCLVDVISIGCRSARNWCGPIGRSLRPCHWHRSHAPGSSREEKAAPLRPARSTTVAGRHFFLAAPVLADPVLADPVLADPVLADLALSHQPRWKRAPNCCNAAHVGINRSDLKPATAVLTASRTA
jgi:hypothetical protein